MRITHINSVIVSHQLTWWVRKVPKTQASRKARDLSSSIFLKWIISNSFMIAIHWSWVQASSFNTCSLDELWLGEQLLFLGFPGDSGWYLQALMEYARFFQYPTSGQMSDSVLLQGEERVARNRRYQGQKARETHRDTEWTRDDQRGTDETRRGL